MDVLRQAHARLEAGDLDAARRMLDSVPAADRSSALWQYARGTLALREGQPKVAQGFFEQAVASEPELADLRANLGAALLEQVKAGDRDLLPRALAELEVAARQPSPLPHVENNLGTARLAAGDAVGALACFDRALEKDPQHVPAHFNRAVALHKLGRRDEAVKVLEALLAADPGFEPARQALKKIQ